MICTVLGGLYRLPCLTVPPCPGRGLLSYELLAIPAAVAAAAAGVLLNVHKISTSQNYTKQGRQGPALHAQYASSLLVFTCVLRRRITLS